MPKEIMKINRDIVLDLFLERLLREGAGFKRVERFGQVITAMRLCPTLTQWADLNQ